MQMSCIRIQGAEVKTRTLKPRRCGTLSRIALLFFVSATRQSRGASKQRHGEVLLDNAFSLIEGHPGSF